MNNRYDWSVGIGRWMGVPIRIHLLMILGVIGVFAIDWHHREPAQILGTGMVTAIVLFLTISFHELAHVWACLSLGGMAHSITIAPWGGTSHLDYPDRPTERMIVDAAGPFLNGAVFALFASMLIGTGHGQLSSLVNPFQPQAFSLSEWQASLIAIVAWCNFQLFLFNLLPCFPFDGVRLLRGFFLGTSPHASGAKIEATLMAIGQLTAVVMILMSVVLRDFNDAPIQPVWSLCLAGGFTLLFAARFEFRRQLRDLEQLNPGSMALERDHDPAFGEGSDSWMHPEVGHSYSGYQEYSQWLNEKQHQAVVPGAEMLDDDLQAEAELADQILDKLHREGIAVLTVKERSFLEQFSRRLRERRSNV